jgi:hypothetical protein
MGWKYCFFNRDLGVFGSGMIHDNRPTSRVNKSTIRRVSPYFKEWSTIASVFINIAYKITKKEEIMHFFLRKFVYLRKK